MMVFGGEWRMLGEWEGLEVARGGWEWLEGVGSGWRELGVAGGSWKWLGTCRLDSLEKLVGHSTVPPLPLPCPSIAFLSRRCTRSLLPSLGMADQSTSTREGQTPLQNLHHTIINL